MFCFQDHLNGKFKILFRRKYETGDEKHETLRKRNVLPTTNEDARELDFEMELAL